MNYKKYDEVMKNCSIENEEDEFIIIEIMRKAIEEGNFLNFIEKYKINKRLLSACMPYLNGSHYHYYRQLLLGYANEHNKPIINEVYDKMEVFK